MLHLTDLEALLASEQGEQQKQLLLTKLQAERQSTKRILLKGLNPDEYKLQNAKAKALDAAVNILTSHKTGN
jgi:hypothetical protein